MPQKTLIPITSERMQEIENQLNEIQKSFTEAELCFICAHQLLDNTSSLNMSTTHGFSMHTVNLIIKNTPS